MSTPPPPARRPLITPERIAQAEDDLALTGQQARVLAAKEGVVVALQEKHDGRLPLKGGTALHSCFGSPRASIADVDYGDARKNAGLDPDELANLDFRFVVFRTLL